MTKPVQLTFRIEKERESAHSASLSHFTSAMPRIKLFGGTLSHASLPPVGGQNHQ